MELSVSNDFLSLFLPEQSEFSTEDLIEEFKIYIFKLMNITVDGLIQEQINNEFENNELKKKYKQFFSNKTESVLNINKLYENILQKNNLIKLNLKKNFNLIENNKLLFSEKLIDQNLNEIIKDIELNKNILKNNYNNSSENLFNLLNIPYLMIDSFINNYFDIYIEYYNFIKNFENNNFNVIKNIKNSANKINDEIVNLLNNLFNINNNSLGIKNNEIFQILNLEFNKIFEENNNNENNSEESKINISVILYQIEKYMNFNKNETNYEKILKYFEEKLIIIYKEKISLNLKEKIYYNLFKFYIFDVIKNYYNYYNEEIENNFISEFINNIKLFDVSKKLLNEVDSIEKFYFFKNIDKFLELNELKIKNYFNNFSEIKKLFLNVIKDDNQINLKYEIIFIINNNLNYINNFIVNENFIKFKDKINCLIKLINHCDNLLNIIIHFFNNNLIIFYMNNELNKEFEEFKINLNNVIINFIKDIYNFFQIKEENNYEDILNNLKIFNNLNNFEDII